VARRKGGKKSLRQVTHKNNSFNLDKFSQADLRTWQRMSDSLEEYHVGLFYYLEGLRQLHHNDLCKALRSATPAKITMLRWVRIVDYKHSLEPLSSKGSLVKGGRFNIGNDIDPGKFPSFPALYIAKNYDTAYLEKFGEPDSIRGDVLSGHELALRKPSSFSSLNISGQLNNLFDLSQPANLRAFGKIISKFKMPTELKVLANTLGIKPPWLISKSSLLKQNLMATNWREWPAQFQIPANPQVFGRLVMDAGFDGVLYQSTRANSKCMAIFPSNIDGSDSYVELADEPPNGIIYTRLDTNSSRDLIK